MRKTLSETSIRHAVELGCAEGDMASVSHSAHSICARLVLKTIAGPLT